VTCRPRGLSQPRGENPVDFSASPLGFESTGVKMSPLNAMNTNDSALPRRAFLRGLGTIMALPYLESFGHRAFAGNASQAAAASRAPVRMAFVYVPNGKNMADWTPTQVGEGFDLPATLQPLAKVRGDLNVISGLAHQHAAAGPDGAGDHARASATFLTGVRAKKTQGADIQVGQSIDQFVAQKVGGLTKFASLELGTDRGQTAGNCDSGYSCAYSFNVSWRTPSQPMPPGWRENIPWHFSIVPGAVVSIQAEEAEGIWTSSSRPIARLSPQPTVRRN